MTSVLTDIGSSFVMSPVRTLSIKPDPAVYSGRDGERLVGVLGGPILESRPVLNAGGNEGGGMALGTIQVKDP